MTLGRARIIRLQRADAHRRSLARRSEKTGPESRNVPSRQNEINVLNNVLGVSGETNEIRGRKPRNVV